MTRQANQNHSETSASRAGAVKTPEEILGLPMDASGEAVERAYRRMALRYPPELHPERFSEIHRAYRRLSSLEERLADAAKDPGATLSRLFPRPRLELKIRAADAARADRADALSPLIRALERRGLSELLRRGYERART